MVFALSRNAATTNDSTSAADLFCSFLIMHFLLALSTPVNIAPLFLDSTIRF